MIDPMMLLQYGADNLSGFSLKKVLRSHARLVSKLPGAKNSMLIRQAAGVKRSWETPVEAETLIDLPEDTGGAASVRAAGGDRRGAALNWKLIAGVGAVAALAAVLLARGKVSHAR